MALHVASGKKMFDRYEVKRPGKVLIMNAEDPKKQLQRRLINLANAMEWDSDEQKYQAFENIAFVDFETDTISLSGQKQRTNHYEITEVVGEIIKAYRMIGLSWVIFDPMTLFGFDEAGGNDSASAMMKASGILADQMNCAVTYVTHTTKAGARSGEADMHTTRGAAAFGDLTRAHWNLVNFRAYDSMTKTRYLQLSFDKSSYAAPQPPVHIMAVENNTFVTYNPEEENDEEFDNKLWEDVKRAIEFLRKSGEACSVDTISTYGYEVSGQHIGRTRVKPKIREWLQEGRLEVVSEGRRRQQLRVSKQFEEENF
jgi:RecA-family ATPase